MKLLKVARGVLAKRAPDLSALEHAALDDDRAPLGLRQAAIAFRLSQLPPALASLREEKLPAEMLPETPPFTRDQAYQWLVCEVADAATAVPVMEQAPPSGSQVPECWPYDLDNGETLGLEPR